MSKLKSPHINTVNISLSVYRHLNVSHLTRAALILGKHGTDTALKTNILAVARTLWTRMKTYTEIRLEHTSKSSSVTLLHTWEFSHFYTFIRQTHFPNVSHNCISTIKLVCDDLVTSSPAALVRHHCIRILRNLNAFNQ